MSDDFVTTKFSERGLDICSGCRSYTPSQRHHDICELGHEYYDFVVRKEGSDAVHYKVLPPQDMGGTDAQAALQYLKKLTRAKALE